MLAKVPRIITSWLPRREPKELKSRASTWFSLRYTAAGPPFLIDPAGEMWSVVTLSPSTASTRALWMSSTGTGSTGRFWKNGGSRTYVERGSHSNSSPVGTSRPFQRSSPSNTAA